MQSGPWSETEGKEMVDRPIPARVVAGGEGEVVRELQGVKTHLLEGLGTRDGDRRSSLALDRVQRRKGLDGDEALVRGWWQGVAGELR